MHQGPPEQNGGSEAILEPHLPIIDPHHHLWVHRGRYLLEELLADIGSSHDVRATVHVDADAIYRIDGDPLLAPLGETEFINGIAAMSASGVYGPARVCAGMVGFADLLQGARVERLLEAHLRAAGDRFKGVRHCTAYDPDPAIQSLPFPTVTGLLLDGRFREGFARLAPLGLSFDGWLYHPQIPEFGDLAEAFSSTTMVLDHLGGPLGIGSYAGRHDEVFAQWRPAIRALARCQNVYIKLGGLGMPLCGFGFEHLPAPASSAELARAWRPYVETCIEAFGTRRCMFESNFPADRPSCTYVVLWNAFKCLAAHCSDEEKADLFHGTAARVYRLPCDPVR